VTYQVAARVYDPAVPSKWLVGPYFPHADLNLTGRVRVDVPEPLPLDPAADLPPQLLGSAWIVAAGPGRAGEPGFTGAPPLATCWSHQVHCMRRVLCLPRGLPCMAARPLLGAAQTGAAKRLLRRGAHQAHYRPSDTLWPSGTLKGMWLEAWRAAHSSPTQTTQGTSGRS